MLESIHNAVNALSGFLYQPFIVPFLLIAAGVSAFLRQSAWAARVPFSGCG